MGVRARGITPAAVRSAFDVEARPDAITRCKLSLAKASGEVQVIAQGMQPEGWSVISDIRGVAYHEFGHHLHFSYWREIGDIVHGSDRLHRRWPLLIGEYAALMLEAFIAESSAQFRAGDERQFYRLHPDLLASFRRKDRRS